MCKAFDGVRQSPGFKTRVILLIFVIYAVVCYQGVGICGVQRVTTGDTGPCGLNWSPPREWATAVRVQSAGALHSHHRVSQRRGRWRCVCVCVRPRLFFFFKIAITLTIQQLYLWLFFFLMTSDGIQITNEQWGILDSFALPHKKNWCLCWQAQYV